MGAREILLLAAEDAFEFERWREAGPVTAEIDPETSAAEIVEYEALGIALPRELDVLRRELEFAPAVREAIRSSTTVLRRNGRAEASALVGLGPQGLMPWGGRGLDPRLLMLMDPRLAVDPRGRVDEPRAKPGRAARAPVVIDDPPPDESFSRRGPVEPELVDEPDDEDDDDDLDDDFEMPPPARTSRATPSARAPGRKPRARSRELDDEDDDSLIAIRPAPSPDRTNTMILAGVSMVAVVALLWIAFGDKDDEPKAAQNDVGQRAQQPPPPQPQPAPAPQPAPELALEPVPTAVPTPAPAPTGSRGSGISSSSRGSSSSSAASSSAAKPASGAGVNPFATYDASVMGGGQPQPKSVVGGTAPAPAPAPTEAQPAPAPAEAVPPPSDPAPAPAPEPLPEPELTKSKMTPAIRDAITKKVGDLQRCYNDALIGKPDLEGRVVFTIALDQDGVVKKVDVGKDAVGYGVAGCASKKIRSWTLPSAGIPIIFDLPFDFQQPKG